ncbi:hypothetical protein F5Y16DRAFT_412811 [Xylariaceae sp. FL0255]|nr:hypothetical protein F5Y16DRAFT_412811 [Xylariaceae sp. FL0255]
MSRTWNAMAVPHLYKSVLLSMRVRNPIDFLRGRHQDRLAQDRSLSSKLLDPSNEDLRDAVHELEFGRFNPRDVDGIEQRLAALVDSLLKLQRVKYGGLSQDVLRQLDRHSKRLLLYMLGEDGKRAVEGELRSVVTLAAKVDPFNVGVDRGPNRDFLGMQALFFACPNLKSFSLTILLDYGGCSPRFPTSGTLFSFQLFSDGRSFPPLEELSLNGYKLSHNEERQWIEKLQWPSSRSLSLGPQNTTTFLLFASDHPTSLRDLTVQVYSDDAHGQDVLEDYLVKRTSLESLIVKGYDISPSIVGLHAGVKHLCLHSFEPVQRSQKRPAFGPTQLRELDASCPNLETLEILIERNGAWPPELPILATSFKNLRRLTLHLGLGIGSVEVRREPEGFAQVSGKLIEPVLTKDSAKDIGKRFFDWRSSSLLSSMGSSKLSLLWEPAYAQFERKYAETIEVHWPIGPGGEPKIVVLPKDPWEF